MIVFAPTITGQQILRECTRTDVRIPEIRASCGRFQMSSMVYHIFLIMVLRLRGPSARAELRYNALITPYFDYCDIVWGNCNKGLSDRLQKLQNRAARVITQSDYEIRSVDILQTLKWDNLEQRRFKHKACTMFKVLNNGAPSYLSSDYNIIGDTCKYNLRESETKLTLPKAKTSALQRSFRYEGVKTWNSLPPSTRMEKTFHTFKRKLQKL